MGYERYTGRNYRGNPEGGGGWQHGDDDGDREGRQRGYVRSYRRPAGYDEDRDFFDRVGDEVRSWFGDDEAERRRRWDARLRERDEQRRYPDGGRFAEGPGGLRVASPRRECT